jgi:hypothetical protein
MKVIIPAPQANGIGLKSEPRSFFVPRTSASGKILLLLWVESSQSRFEKLAVRGDSRAYGW